MLEESLKVRGRKFFIFIKLPNEFIQDLIDVRIFFFRLINLVVRLTRKVNVYSGDM